MEARGSHPLEGTKMLRKKKCWDNSLRISVHSATHPLSNLSPKYHLVGAVEMGGLVDRKCLLVYFVVQF